MKWNHLFCDDGAHSSFVDGHVELTTEFIAEAESVNAENLASFKEDEIEIPTLERSCIKPVGENEDGTIWDFCNADDPNGKPITGYYWFR